MEDRIQQPQKVFRLNLEKYGLTGLEGRDIFSLSSEELDRFLEALGNDDISVTLPVPFTPENIREILAGGTCRRCAGCCLPNPLNPDSPGVEVFEEELRIIAGFLGSPPDELLQDTLEGQNQDLPYPLDEFIATRRLLPNQPARPHLLVQRCESVPSCHTSM